MRLIPTTPSWLRTKDYNPYATCRPLSYIMSDAVRDSHDQQADPRRPQTRSRLTLHTAAHMHEMRYEREAAAIVSKGSY
jgi:hypothetical protein